MTDRIEAGSLRVDKELYDFINDFALPGTDISSQDFWYGFEEIVNDLTPINRSLLAKRDELQIKIDAWYEEHRGETSDLAVYKLFLKEYKICLK